MNKEMLPKVAIVGKPNVGKSSIYNRMIGKRESIIDPTPGVTRDRQYHHVRFNDYNFMLIDTGGITLDEEDSFADIIKIQSEIAITEAQVILYVVEVNGLTEDDFTIAELLRKSEKELIILVNKCDNQKLEQSISDFYKLGLGEVIPISAMHGSHFYSVLEKISQKIPKVGLEEKVEKLIKVAIIGKPNVGKSSLLNHVLDQERSLVSDIPGTTRDTIQGSTQFLGYDFQFLDTAGMRKKAKVTDDIEYYSVNRAIKSIEKADITVHLIDSLDNITDQDKKIMGVANTRGRAIIIALNKWDIVEAEADFETYVDLIRFKFAIAAHIPIVSISAKTGLRVKKLIQTIIDIYKQYTLRVDTNELNSVLQKAQIKYPPPSRKGKLKIYYGTQISTAPPKFLLFINRKDSMSKNYKDYLTNQLRSAFHFNGVPIFIFTKKSE